LLLVEIRGAENRKRGSVAEAGEAEHLRPKKPAPRPELVRAAVLDVEVDITERSLDGDVADHVARSAAGGAERQPNRVARQVAREKQVAFRLVAVEHRLLRQLIEVAGDDPFGAARISAHADLRQMRHQHLELDGAAADGLLRHLDGGDIAGVTKDRPGAVADLAHHRDRHVATDERRIGACKLLWSEALQPVELGAAKDKMDGAILRLVERAG